MEDLLIRDQGRGQPIHVHLSTWDQVGVDDLDSEGGREQRRAGTSLLRWVVQHALKQADRHQVGLRRE